MRFDRIEYKQGVLTYERDGKSRVIVGWRARGIWYGVTLIAFAAVLTCASVVTAPCWGSAAILYQHSQDWQRR